jgi:hypothetical protein
MAEQQHYSQGKGTQNSMSFYTLLRFYLPTKPPTIRTDELSRFVSDFATLAVAEPGESMTLELAIETSTESPALSLAEDLAKHGSNAKFDNWELTEHFDSYGELASRLSKVKKHVHRAFINLGHATAPIIDQFSRLGSAENDTDFSADGWSLEVGPVESFGLDSEIHHLVGWVSVDLS